MPPFLFLVLLFCSLLSASLLHHLLVLCLLLQQFLHPLLVFRSTVQNHWVVEGSAIRSNVTHQINYAWLHMTQTNYYMTSISHHLVNAALTKCRLKGKIDTHPIPCLYMSSSSDLATLQGSPQKNMDTGTPLGRGIGSKAFPVIWPWLQLNQFCSKNRKRWTINPKPRVFHLLHINETII
jgi:hypothetical protein